MSKQQEFRNIIVYTLLDKFNRSHNFEDLTDEVTERICNIADKLSTLPEEIIEAIEEEDKRPKLPLNTPVSELYGIPNNILLHLKKAGIKTLADIVEHDTLGLCRYRNIGRKAIDQITYFLKANNLKLKDQ